MIFDKDAKNLDDYVTSEGKLLEITPIIESPSGQSYMLPPVIWPVPNELIGCADYHYFGRPYNMWTREYIQIPGTNASAEHRLSFMIRIMEASPDNEPRMGVQMKSEDVKAIIDAIKSDDEPDEPESEPWSKMPPCGHIECSYACSRRRT